MDNKFWLLIATFLMVIFYAQSSVAGVFDAMEKALMPGELSTAHEKYLNECTVCHKFFGKGEQGVLCMDCHDHKNISEDVSKGQGYHGRIPGIKTKECKTCHIEHKGRNATIVLLDKQTFNHSQTDFDLRGRHKDAQCNDCHKEKKPYHDAPSRCISCHKKVDPHEGRLGKECGACHRESSWQDFSFDHSKTEFKLEGKHKGVECRNCHPQERYRGIPKKCFACHKRDDRHDGRYGEKCQDCHVASGWGSQKFDHDKDTEFPLKGNHGKVTCQQCHKESKKDKVQSEKEKRDCYSCHRLQDEHKGQYGKKCKSCHTEKNWTRQIFDHGKTDYPLKGKHRDINCGDCHSGRNIYKEKLKTTCYSCHRDDDVHKGQQGKKCQECHNEKGWQDEVKFDHGLTKFPLLGAHVALACEECHSSGAFKETKPQCLSCHQNDDIHKRALGKRCDHCHYVGDWKAWEFDHDKQTDFKLEDSHKGIVCSACHSKPAEDKVEAMSDCQSCHLRDDVHNGEFGRHCQRCHSTKSFSDIRM